MSDKSSMWRSRSSPTAPAPAAPPQWAGLNGGGPD